MRVWTRVCVRCLSLVGAMGVVFLVGRSSVLAITPFRQSAAPVAATGPFKVHAIDPILEAGSPDGKWAIYRKADAPGRLYLRTLATGADQVLANIDGVVDGFAWSRDSRYLALTVAEPSDPYRQKAKPLVVTVAGGDVRELAVVGTSVQPLGWTNAGELFYKALITSPNSPAPGTWQYSLVKSSGGESRLLLAPKGRPAFSPGAITPDGTALIGMTAGGMARYDLATGQQQSLGLPGAEEPIVSPDGRTLAYFKWPAVYVASLDEIPVRQSIQLADVGHSHDRLVAWWTNDGQFVMPAVVKYASTAYRIDLDARTGLARGPLKVLVRTADHPKISPDGRRVAHTPDVGGYTGTIGADGTAPVRSPDESGQMLGWRSPQVALMTEKNGVSAWDTKTGTVSSIATFTDEQGVVGYVPATDEVLYQVGKGKALVLKARALATGIERVIPILENSDQDAVAISPDGRHIAYTHATGDSGDVWTSSELVLATMDGRLEKTLATTNARGLRPACWSPDGKLLLYYDSKQWSMPWYVLNIETLAVRPLLDASERVREWFPPLIRAQQSASASSVITGPVDWESADYPGTSWSPDGSFIVLGGYSTWREPQGKVWEGVTSAALAPARRDNQAPAAAGPAYQGPTKVVLLGTGTPTADPDRFGPAVAVVIGDKSYLVDAGVGVVRRAAAARIPALSAVNLQRVFITHLHSDHTLGLPDLMFSPWVLNRPTPLDVYGPAGIEDMTAAIEKAWSADIDIRLNGGEAQTTRNYRALTHRLKPGRVYEDDKVKIDAIPVLHGAWPEAYGFRFQTADRVVVISGDTRPAQTIADACNGCDVLIHEVYAPRGAKWEAYDKAFHTSTSELAELATKAHPRLLVLYHTLGGSPDVLVAQLRAAGYKGLVVVAQDLDVY